MYITQRDIFAQSGFSSTQNERGQWQFGIQRRIGSTAVDCSSRVGAGGSSPNLSPETSCRECVSWFWCRVDAVAPPQEVSHEQALYSRVGWVLRRFGSPVVAAGVEVSRLFVNQKLAAKDEAENLRATAPVCTHARP